MVRYAFWLRTEYEDVFFLLASSACWRMATDYFVASARCPLQLLAMTREVGRGGIR